MMPNVILSHRPGDDFRAQAEVFSEIFLVFLVIGTLVGLVVVSYTLYNGYKYRDTDARAAEADADGFEKPRVGELPSQSKDDKSKKLFVSFAISAVIVISLVVYAYTLFIYVEAGPSSAVADDAEDTMEIEVTAIQFGWQFEYVDDDVPEEDHATSFNTLYVPQDEDVVIRLDVTASDVWHTFGVTELRIKADAIPGQTDTTWFIPEETGTYTIECFELCGDGHSGMIGEIVVMEQAEFDDWYQDQVTDEDETDDEEAESDSETENQAAVDAAASQGVAV